MLNLKAGDIEWDDERTYYSYRGKGGKNGRRELPRPAFEAIQRTLADCGRTLATMGQEESLWRAAAKPEVVLTARCLRPVPEVPRRCWTA